MTIVIHSYYCVSLLCMNQVTNYNLKYSCVCFEFSMNKKFSSEKVPRAGVEQMLSIVVQIAQLIEYCQFESEIICSTLDLETY